MDTLTSKIIVGVLTFILSAFFGLLPMFLSIKCGLEADHPPTNRTKKKLKNVILSFLLNFGGGVLAANAFCHWLPENIEGKNLHVNLMKVIYFHYSRKFICIGFY